MEGLSGQVSKALLDYGALGILIILLIIAVVVLFRINQKIYTDNVLAHEKRVEDAKKFAAEHAAAVAKLETTASNLQELFSAVKDISRRE